MKLTIGTQATAAAKKAYVKYGVPASVTLAQYVLESGNGAHEPLNSNNPFGIKALQPPWVEANTTEVINGVVRHVTAYFKAYASLDAAFDDHARLLATAKPYAGIKHLMTSPLEYAKALTGIYATDPNYGSKLVAIITDNNLTQYDTNPAAAVTKATAVAAAASVAGLAISKIPPHYTGISVSTEHWLIAGVSFLCGILLMITIAFVLYLVQRSKPANPGNLKEMYEMFLQSYQPILDYINAKQAQSVADAKTISDLQGQVTALQGQVDTAAAAEKQNETDTLGTLTAATTGDGVTPVAPPLAT